MRTVNGHAAQQEDRRSEVVARDGDGDRLGVDPEGPGRDEYAAPGTTGPQWATRFPASFGANKRTGRRPVQPFTIRVDTREQLSYGFESVTKPVIPFDIEVGTLPTGDYSVRDGTTEYFKSICVERKSKSDAYGTFGHDRDRFERELERMAEFAYAAVVIEADWTEIFNEPPRYSTGMKPKTISSSIVAWSQRYGVHFFLCPHREFAERLTHRILERWIRDQRERNSQVNQAI